MGSQAQSPMYKSKNVRSSTSRFRFLHPSIDGWALTWPCTERCTRLALRRAREKSGLLSGDWFLRALIANQMSRWRITGGLFRIDNSAKQNTPHGCGSLVIQTDVGPLVHYNQGKTQIREYLTMTCRVHHAYHSNP